MLVGLEFDNRNWIVMIQDPKSKIQDQRWTLDIGRWTVFKIDKNIECKKECLVNTPHRRCRFYRDLCGAPPRIDTGPAPSGITPGV